MIAVPSTGKARKDRNKDRRERKTTMNITSPQILHWSCHVDGPVLGVRVKEKGKKKSTRGRDPLPFTVTLVYTSDANQIFPAVLFAHVQTAPLNLSPGSKQRDSGLSRSPKVEQDVDSEQVCPPPWDPLSQPHLSSPNRTFETNQTHVCVWSFTEAERMVGHSEQKRVNRAQSS